MAKSWQALAAVGFCLLAVLFLEVGLVQGLAAGDLEAQAPETVEYQLLTNPGLETYNSPYDKFDGVNCQVATGWQRFWYGGPQPCWMDTRVFAGSHLGGGWVERIEGETSQMIVATEPYTAGLRQTVSGLTPGVGYGFHAALLTIFQTSAQEPVDGTMIKEVGIDPTGGTDAQAPTVIWSEPDGHDQGPWDVKRRTSAFADGSTVTVFIRITSPYPSGGLPLMNLSFLDSAILAQTPLVRAASPVATAEPAFLVTWKDAVPAPGGKILSYDVQWLEESEGVWHDWLVRTTNLGAVFSGEPHHVYRFRARARQEYENGARLFGPFRPAGDTRTYVGWPRLAATVLNPEGGAVAGATVGISGTAYTATSGPDGRVLLDLSPLAEPQTIVAGHPAWQPPDPVYDVQFGLTGTVALTWTLPPPGDALLNGGFEAGLAGWSPPGGEVGAPEAVAEPVHTGRGALALAPTAPEDLTVGVSQTVVVSGAWEPALSFWYYPQDIQSGDVLNILFAVGGQTAGAVAMAPVTEVFTPALDVPGWHHEWYHPGPPNVALSGTVEIRLQLQRGDEGSTAVVYLDDLTFAATPGGPYKSYLPLIQRR
jgi:hypothetical protein